MISARFFDIEANKFLQAIIRDILERKKMKEAIRTLSYGTNGRLQREPGATRDFHTGRADYFSEIAAPDSTNTLLVPAYGTLRKGAVFLITSKKCWWCLRKGKFFL